MEAAVDEKTGYSPRKDHVIKEAQYKALCKEKRAEALMRWEVAYLICLFVRNKLKIDLQMKSLLLHLPWMVTPKKLIHGIAVDSNGVGEHVSKQKLEVTTLLL